MNTDEYSQYTEERTNPRAYRCPQDGQWFHDQHGQWRDEVWCVCETCGGTGEVSPQDWDEME